MKRVRRATWDRAVEAFEGAEFNLGACQGEEPGLVAELVREAEWRLAVVLMSLARKRSEMPVFSVTEDGGLRFVWVGRVMGS